MFPQFLLRFGTRSYKMDFSSGKYYHLAFFIYLRNWAVVFALWQRSALSTTVNIPTKKNTTKTGLDHLRPTQGTRLPMGVFTLILALGLSLDLSSQATDLLKLYY